MNPNLCIPITSIYMILHIRQKIKHPHKTAIISWHERVMLMKEPILYTPADTPVMRHTVAALKRRGMVVIEAPAPEMTHLLLPLPHSTLPEHLRKELPSHITVIGGNLNIPGPCMDLMKDELYLAQNAMITAHIAINLAAQQLPVVLGECPILILGWGRIGKCLTKLLTALGADVTVAARKPTDRAIIRALGCQAAEIHRLNHILRRYRVIFNTVPFPVLEESQTTYCREDCIKIELASQPGIAGTDVMQARGLPGKYAPESSGKLIAQTVCRLLIDEEARK